MLAQFVDGGVVIPPDLIGKRQVGGIEDARLCPEQLEQAGSFLDREARIRALPQRAVKQQDARRWLVGTETFGRAGMDEGRIERREAVGVGQGSQTGQGNSPGLAISRAGRTG